MQGQQSRIPQLFGAPAPQDTGGAFSALIGAESRAAESAVAAMQNAVAQAAQGLQFGMQTRARKDEQLREIEAQSALEKARQAAADERARLEREQQNQQFKAQQRLAREGMRRDTAYRGRQLGLDVRRLDEQSRANQAQEGFQGAMLRLRAREVESGAAADAAQRDLALQEYQRNREDYERARMAEQQKALAFQFMGQLMREMPDGTIEPQLERIAPFLERLQGTPYNAETQDLARDTNAAANIADELERRAAGRNERAMKRTDQGTDLMRAMGAGRGGDGVQVHGAPVFPVTPAALSALDKVYGVPINAKGVLAGDAATPGRQVLWDAANRRLIGTSLPEQDRAELERVITSNPDLEAAFTGGAAAAFDGPQKQIDIGRSLIGGFASQQQPGPAQQAPQGQAPSQQQPQPPPGQPGAARSRDSVDRLWADVGAAATEAEPPPGRDGAAGPRATPSDFRVTPGSTGPSLNTNRGGRYRGPKDTPPPKGGGRPEYRWSSASDRRKLYARDDAFNELRTLMRPTDRASVLKELRSAAGRRGVPEVVRSASHVARLARDAWMLSPQEYEDWIQRLGTTPAP